MLALALADPILRGPGLGLWWIHPILTLLWIGLLVTLIVLVVRRGRRGPWGPGGRGPWGPWGGADAHSARSAEATLAERFAQGDIDEKEYRARLEVLRSGSATPPGR